MLHLCTERSACASELDSRACGHQVSRGFFTGQHEQPACDTAFSLGTASDRGRRAAAAQGLRFGLQALLWPARSAGALLGRRLMHTSIVTSVLAMNRRVAACGGCVWCDKLRERVPFIYCMLPATRRHELVEQASWLAVTNQMLETISPCYFPLRTAILHAVF